MIGLPEELPAEVAELLRDPTVYLEADQLALDRGPHLARPARSPPPMTRQERRVAPASRRRPPARFLVPRRARPSVTFRPGPPCSVPATKRLAWTVLALAVLLTLAVGWAAVVVAFAGAMRP